MLKQINLHKVEVFFILIILLTAIFWRFANFPNRWTLNQDQARDAIIALEAINKHELPLIGPPSSAGPFSFGPFYYWIIIFFTAIPTINSPWIGFTLLSVATTIIFFFLGYSYGGKSFGFFLGIIASFCTAQIFNAPDMLNPMPIAFSTTLTFLLLIKLIDKNKPKYAFWLGLIVGISINFHYQALGLIVLFPFAAVINNFISWQIKIKVIVLNFLGFLIAFLPLLYFNFTVHNRLFTKFTEFAIGDKSRFGSNYNLLSDVLVFWPKLWGGVLSGIPLLGYFYILIFILALIFTINKKIFLKKSFLIISLTMLSQILILFLYKGIRMPVYLIVFQPFFIFFTGWSVWVFYKLYKPAGLVLILILLLSAMPANWAITQDNHSQVTDIFAIKRAIDSKVSDSINLISDTNSNMVSLPLYYLYLKENRTSDSGKEIFACQNHILKDERGIDSKWSCPSDTQTIAEILDYKIYYKNNLSPDQLKELNLASLEKERIYNWLYDNYNGKK